MIRMCCAQGDSKLAKGADDAILSLATQGASARREPVIFLGNARVRPW